MDLHINNTIYLLHTAACAYLRAHRMTRREFGAVDDRCHILRYVATCPSRFDALPETEMVRELDDYVHVYGDLFDPESKATLLRLLNPERLGVQWYVRTQSVADRLIAEFRPVDWRGFA